MKQALLVITICLLLFSCKKNTSDKQSFMQCNNPQYLDSVAISNKIAGSWTLIKQQYPDIEEICTEIPDWQKELLTSRLEAIAQNPERVKPIQGLFDALDKKVSR